MTQCLVGEAYIWLQLWKLLEPGSAYSLVNNGRGYFFASGSVGGESMKEKPSGRGLLLALDYCSNHDHVAKKAFAYSKARDIKIQIFTDKVY